MWILLCTEPPRKPEIHRVMEARLVGDCFRIQSSTLGWIKNYPALNPYYQLMAKVTRSAMCIFLQVMRCWPCVFKRKLCSLKNQHKIPENEHIERVIISPSFSIAMTCDVSCWQCQVWDGKVETRNAHFSRDNFEKESSLEQMFHKTWTGEWPMRLLPRTHLSAFFGSNDQLTEVKLPSISPRLQ